MAESVKDSGQANGDSAAATLRFLEADLSERADQIFTGIGRGHYTNWSMIYQVEEYGERWIHERKDAYDGVLWTPLTIDPVDIAADPSAGSRNAIVLPGFLRRASRTAVRRPTRRNRGRRHH